MSELSKKTLRTNPTVQLLTLLVLFYSYTVTLLPTQGGDLLFWASWASYILEHGLVSVYETYISPEKGQSLGFMYGPVYMYLLYVFSEWQGSVHNIYANVHQIKALHLVFDMIGVWYAVSFVREPTDRPFYALFLVFNVSLLYNTVAWGQTDGILACFMVVALYYALRRKIIVSGVVFALSLLIKPQPIIFLPLLGLLWLSACLQKPLSYTLRSGFLALLCVAAAIAPFLIAGTFGDYVAIVLDTPQSYPVVTINAANVWTLLLSGNTDAISNRTTYLGTTYQQWGWLLFAVSYLVILFPVLRQFYQIQTGRRERFTATTVLLVSGLIPIVFYFFNTQMHERYAHFSVLLLGAYALASKKFASYVVVSVANFWIMNHFLKTVNIGWFDTIPLEYIALLFFVGLSWGIIQLYIPILPRSPKTLPIPVNQV